MFRPDGWFYAHDLYALKAFPDGVHADKLRNWAKAYEDGADAMLEARNELDKTLYAMLCGIRMEKGKTDWYSQLDSCIDQLRDIVGYPK